MTPDEQRIAIAEFCGFSDIGPSELWEDWDEPPAVRLVGRWTGRNVRKEVPDYLIDLNAMHEAEEKIEDRQEYQKALWQIARRDKAHVITSQDMFDSLHATAAQRAEALLKVIGKWKE